MGVQVRFTPPPSASAIRSPFVAFKSDAAEWCQGRSWIWRVPLLLYLVWVGFHHVKDATYVSLFGGITLGIHELGHLLLFWAGRFLSTAGGSLAQVAAPAAAAWLLYRQRDYFGVAVATAWLAFSLFGLATYVADARAQELPLVALTADPIHDWQWLLEKLGILEWDHRLAFLTRVAAFAIWLGSLTLGGWLVWTMAARRSPH